LLNTPVELMKVVPSLTKVKLVAPVEVTVMLAVATAQVGWVTLTDGVPGANGCAFTVPVTAADIQPATVLAVML